LFHKKTALNSRTNHRRMSPLFSLEMKIMMTSNASLCFSRWRMTFNVSDCALKFWEKNLVCPHLSKISEKKSSQSIANWSLCLPMSGKQNGNGIVDWYQIIWKHIEISFDKDQSGWMRFSNWQMVQFLKNYVNQITPSHRQMFLRFDHRTKDSVLNWKSNAMI
jgi:hypothetical protein